MKNIVIAAAFATMISSAAFAQAGANPSAPQPSADGRGVNIPGTTTTGTAVDRSDSNQRQENADQRRMTVKDGISKDVMSK